MQKECLIGGLHLISHLGDPETPWKRMRTDCRSQKEIEDIRGTWSTKLTKHGSHGLTEMELSSMGPTWVCLRTSAYVMAVSGVFLRDLKQRG